MPNIIRPWLDFALQQISAESYLQGIDLGDTAALTATRAAMRA
jgi:hypothetical protein